MLACSTGKYDGVRIFQKSSKIPTLSESFLLFTLAIRKSTIKDERNARLFIFPKKFEKSRKVYIFVKSLPKL